MGRFYCKIIFLIFLVSGCEKDSGSYPFQYYYSQDYYSKNYLDDVNHPDELPAGVGFDSYGGNDKIRCGTVSHHFLVAPLIDAYFKNIKDNRTVSTFIIITPKHFHYTSDFAVASDVEWQTGNGVVKINRKYTDYIIKRVPEIKKRSYAFHEEHGIGALAPFIHKYFPGSKIVQIGFDENKKRFSTAYRLAGVIKEITDRDSSVMLLISADFSHNADRKLTDYRDGLSRKNLDLLDKNKVMGINTDNSAGIYVMTEYCELNNIRNNFVFAHTDSGVYSGKDYGEMTSYFFTFQH